MRFFRYGELPLVLLALLERESLNGYELMGELDRFFSPRYVSSAGSVYPALSALEAEGLIEAVGDESPKRFKLTRAGVKALADRRYKLAEIERRTGVYVSRTDHIEDQLARLTQTVRTARPHASPDDIERVLRRATKQINELTE